MSKIMMTLLAVVVIVIMGMNTTVYAAEPVPYGGGEQKEFKTVQQQKEEFLARTDKSIAEKEAAILHFNKLEALQQGIHLSQPKTRASTYAYIYMDVYQQENGYYCGPATLKQTETYLTGSAPEQSVIAESVGTTSSNGTELSKMKEYLIDNTSHAYTDIWWYASQSAFINTIISSINDDIPPVLHMSAGSADVGGKYEWPYTTNGHYMNIRGYMNSGAQISVADPYGYEGGGITSGNYFVSDDILYDTMSYLIV